MTFSPTLRPRLNMWCHTAAPVSGARRTSGERQAGKVRRNYVGLDPEQPARLATAAEPGGPHAGLGGAGDVPLVAGHEQHAAGLGAESPRREGVELRRRLVATGLVGGQQVVEAMGEPDVSDQRAYAVARAVREHC